MDIPYTLKTQIALYHRIRWQGVRGMVQTRTGPDVATVSERVVSSLHVTLLTVSLQVNATRLVNVRLMLINEIQRSVGTFVTCESMLIYEFYLYLFHQNPESHKAERIYPGLWQSRVSAGAITDFLLGGSRQKGPTSRLDHLPC